MHISLKIWIVFLFSLIHQWILFVESFFSWFKFIAEPNKFVNFYHYLLTGLNIPDMAIKSIMVAWAVTAETKVLAMLLKQIFLKVCMMHKMHEMNCLIKLRKYGFPCFENLHVMHVFLKQQIYLQSIHLPTCFHSLWSI